MGLDLASLRAPTKMSAPVPAQRGIASLLTPALFRGSAPSPPLTSQAAQRPVQSESQDLFGARVCP